MYFFCKFISVNKFLLANQVKRGQIPIPHCPHMFLWSPLPHYYCNKRIFLPPFCTPIIHICEQVSSCKSSQVGSNPHSPLSPYVPPGPIAPLLLRQARILASLLHANHSCLWTSFSLRGSYKSMQLHDCHKIRIVRKNVLANASREIFPVDGSIKVHCNRRKKVWGNVAYKNYLTY